MQIEVAMGQQSSANPDVGRPTLEEVVVTAQRRQERLQDVPISIAVLDGDTLDGTTVEGLTQILNRVPGVSADTTNIGGGTRLVLRGVGAGGATFTGSSPISYYIDGAPFGLVKSAILPDANPYDLKRVEVLRGPQGTLYGANAQNGVVRILTHDADSEKFEFKARTSASSTQSGGGNYRGDAAVNMPIVDSKLAARAVVGYQDLSGWIDRPSREDANDAAVTNVRVKVDASPNDRLKLGFAAWRSRAGYGAPSTGDDGERSSFSLDESYSTGVDTFGVKAEWDLPGVWTTSNTSYLDFANASRLDVSSFGLAAPTLFTNFDAHAFTQEMNLGSDGRHVWQWTAGAFYRSAADRLRQNHLGGGAPYDFSYESTSWAAYGEVGRRFFREALGWAIGARYFQDDVVTRENISQGQPGDPLIKVSDSFTATTPRLVLNWYPSETLTTYASYSQGFRSGFQQDPPVTRAFPFPAVKPDKLHNYELGAKGSLLNGRIQIDSSAYYIVWDDVQQTVSVLLNGTNTSAQINGQSASGLGVDAALVTAPIRGLELSVSGNWNGLEMDGDVLSEGAVLFHEGDRLNLSPEYTLGASAEYSIPISTDLSARVSLSGNYTSGQDFRSIFGGAAVVTHSDSIMLTRATASLESASRWTATVFVDNLNDERGSPLISPYNSDWSLRIRPRTTGVQFEYRY